MMKHTRHLTVQPEYLFPLFLLYIYRLVVIKLKKKIKTHLYDSIVENYYYKTLRFLLFYVLIPKYPNSQGYFTHCTYGYIYIYTS